MELNKPLQSLKLLLKLGNIPKTKDCFTFFSFQIPSLYFELTFSSLQQVMSNQVQSHRTVEAMMI